MEIRQEQCDFTAYWLDHCPETDFWKQSKTQKSLLSFALDTFCLTQELKIFIIIRSRKKKSILFLWSYFVKILNYFSDVIHPREIIPPF